MSELFGGQKVVVASADAALRTRVVDVLQGQGFDVTPAHCADDAKRLVRQGTVHLLLWDGVFDIVFGWPVELCVMWMVRDDDREQKKRALLSGAADIVELPLDDVDLTLRVRNQLALQNMEDMYQRQKDFMQEELTRATQSLVESQQMGFLGTLSGGIGHELKNLAQVMQGLLDRGANDDGQADLAYVYEQLRMHAFHLQDLGKANDDDATHVLFGDVIDRVLRNGKLSGRLKHVTVQVFGVDDAMVVRGSQHRLEQVLNNLVLNAADAALETASMKQRAEVDIVLRLDGDDLVVEVEDTGAGIEPADLENIFKPYFTTKEKGKGTGLGLCVVQTILQDHGTALDVDQRDKGAIFRFRLPLAQVSKQAV